ncbi:MAG: hypothetical protein RLN81_12675 [Balneolaceae bacterium]
MPTALPSSGYKTINISNGVLVHLETVSPCYIRDEEQRGVTKFTPPALFYVQMVSATLYVPDDANLSDSNFQANELTILF